MRAVSLDHVQPSMRLGKTLFAPDGRILLHRGTELSEKYIQHLNALGFSAIYIEDTALADVESRELVSEQTRQEAIAAVKEVFTDFKPASQKQKFNQDWSSRRALYNAASAIINEISGSRHLCFQMMELRSADGYTFAHSVNVCLLGMALARRLEVPHNKLIDLAIGLMIHDIGKLTLPDELRDPDRQLSDPEQAVYETHCKNGFGLLRDLGATFGATSKIVAMQHHERWDGQGYPNGLRGEEIHEFAQICAVANTYDRLTTSAAFGRRALPHEALEFLMGAGGSHFRLPLVQAFLDIVAPYPLGTTVKLSNGDRGVVIAIEKGLPQRPVVRMVGPSDFADRDVALAKHRDLVVVGVGEY